MAKSFQSSNVPLTTPRRALGDVGNTIQPSGTTTKKGLRFKSNQLKSCGKTPSATKTHQGTPLTKGLPLLQQIGNTSLKQSGKQRQGLCPKMAEKSREKTQQDFQKELMYPFTDRGVVYGILNIKCFMIILNALIYQAIALCLLFISCKYIEQLEIYYLLLYYTK